MKLKSLFAVFTFCLIALMSQSTLAQRPFGGGGFPGGMQGGPGGGQRGPDSANFEEQFSRLLDLTDAQKAQIKSLREQSQNTAQPFYEQLKPLLEQIHTLSESAVFDEVAARNLAAQMSQIQIEIHLIQLKTQSAIYNLLTTEQKAKLAELRQMMGGRPHQGSAPTPVPRRRPGQ